MFTLYRCALQRWVLLWRKTPESNLEPLDPNGPLPFTSSALLSLAFVQKYFAVTRTRKLYTWEPSEVAQVLHTSPPVRREWSSLLAAHHATNFLATLVNLGIQYLKHNQLSLWNVEATLCGLDCAVFLEKWLLQVHETSHSAPLTGLSVPLQLILRHLQPQPFPYSTYFASFHY